MFHYFRWQSLFAISATDELWRELSDYARASRPSYLVGFASSIHRMACSIKHHQLEPPGSQRMLSAAEPFSDSQRRAIEPHLGGAVFTTYGSREFVSIGAECAERDGLRILAENLLVETAQPAPAGPSEILVSDPHLHAAPIARYAIGDFCLLASGTCACGRSLPRLREITGCSGEHLRLANGREVTHRAWFHTLKEIEEIREFQVLQSSRGCVVPRLVTTGGLRQESKALIHRELTRILGSETELRVEETPEIPLSPVSRLRRIIPWEKMPENEREV